MRKNTPCRRYGSEYASVTDEMSREPFFLIFSNLVLLRAVLNVYGYGLFASFDRIFIEPSPRLQKSVDSQRRPPLHLRQLRLPPGHCSHKLRLASAGALVPLTGPNSGVSPELGIKTEISAAMKPFF